MNYSWHDEEALYYGIVKISVANIRSWPVFQSELTNQTLMGTIVPVIDEKNDHCLIRNSDGYRGWISKHALTRMNHTEVEAWQTGNRVVVTANYGVVRRQPDESSEILTDLVPCVVLKKLEDTLGSVRVELPDGQTGFVPGYIVLDEHLYKKIHADRQQVIATAKKFLGIPYLWGGTSTKGFDCSGFVQTVYRLLNFDLPRDSGPMSRQGTEIDISDLANLDTADLVFFGKTAQRINHVGIYLDDGRYIHSRGHVGINSFHKEDPLYEEYLHTLFVKAVRILS